LVIRKREERRRKRAITASRAGKKNEEEKRDIAVLTLDEVSIPQSLNPSIPQSQL